MSVWLSQSGPHEYVRVQFYLKWAELDAPLDTKLKEHSLDLVRMESRISNCAEASATIIDVVHPEMSLPRSTAIPKMMRTLRVRVPPEKINEYITLIQNEMLPAVKKAGLHSYEVVQRRYGAPMSEFLSVYGEDGWAGQDQPFAIAKAIGSQAWQQYLAKARAISIENEENVYLLQPDLSYMPARP